MTVPALKTVTRTQGNTAALKDGTVAPAASISTSRKFRYSYMRFRRMGRGLEFDVCEMALTTYLCARSTAFVLPPCRSSRCGRFIMGRSFTTRAAAPARRRTWRGNGSA